MIIYFFVFSLLSLVGSVFILNSIMKSSFPGSGSLFVLFKRIDGLAILFSGKLKTKLIRSLQLIFLVIFGLIVGWVIIIPLAWFRFIASEDKKRAIIMAYFNLILSKKMTSKNEPVEPIIDDTDFVAPD